MKTYDRECETCVKRKTMFCPNSSECIELKDKPYYQNRIMLLEENAQQKERIDKAIEVINTQMKLAEDGVKENLRIIKFYLIKGECSVYDLTTEEDYKY